MNAPSAIVLVAVLALAALAAWRVWRKGAPCECGGDCREHCKCCSRNSAR